MRVIVRVNWNIRWPQDFPQRYDPAWYAERLALWTGYTMPSLLRQTFGSWECWLMCDPTLQHHTIALHDSLPDSRFRMIWHRPTECKRHGHEPVFLCRIDSDDMYHPDAIADMAKAVKPDRFVQCMQGYCYSPEAGEVRRWRNPSPAFLGKMFPAEEFRSAPALDHHGLVAATSIKIQAPRFVVVCHGGNISNRFASSDTVQGAEREQVKVDYGI